MTHEGRMQRGAENEKKGLLENADTKYYLEHKNSSQNPPKAVKSTPKKKAAPQKKKA